MTRPRKGQRVTFVSDASNEDQEQLDPVSGLRFTLTAQIGGEVQIDYVALKPRRLALAVTAAFRHFVGPGGSIRSRHTIVAYVTALPKFFDYLASTGDRIDGVDDLRAEHIDGFENWLVAKGLSRPHLFTLLVKVVATLRQIGIDTPGALSPDLRDRIRYVSARPFERSRPRDALSPFVARQLRDAARKDIAAIVERISAGPTCEDDPVVERTNAAAHAVIMKRGVLMQDDPEWLILYQAHWRRGRKSPDLSARLHGAHHLTAADVIPFLVLLALDTGLEIECCKALTIDCLRNASAGTVELAYIKNRARGSEHKTIRVRDRGSTTPGGIIRQLIDLTAAARQHHASDNLWVYFRSGALTSGIRYPQLRIDAWTERHRIVDDEGRRIKLRLSQLRKTHKALWYLKTEGHMARFAVGHTVDVAARHYADIPSLRPLHEQTVADAFAEAVSGPRIVPASDDPQQGPDCATADSPATEGVQEVWLASCGGFYASPFGPAGAACPTPFWGCLDCTNAVITTRKLPTILAFLSFIEGEREGMAADQWAAKFGHVHKRITEQILPAFGDGVLAQARADLLANPPALYLPPEARL